MEKINKSTLKRQRTKICSIDDFKKILKQQNFNFESEEQFFSHLKSVFNVNNEDIHELYKCFEEENISFKVSNVKELFDYIYKIRVFGHKYISLMKKLSNVKRFIIKRVEYERIPSSIDNVEYIKNDLKIPLYKSIKMSSEAERNIIETLEDEISYNHIYSKDIELLKKIIIGTSGLQKEDYNEETMVKTLYIDVCHEYNMNYIGFCKGSVEYYKYLNDNIPRINRLLNNIDKYIKKCSEESTYLINQSSAIQDSVNIAIAFFGNKEFKAVSGKNDIKSYCTAPLIVEETFESCKINKRGVPGTGYKRVNDSEKKIFEEIHRQIENNFLNNKGELILYSKWQPCFSCYYVINQFCRIHPDINVTVKYDKVYGQK